MLDLASEAEAAGWDGFFLWDHLLSGGHTPVTDPWVVMSALAVRTERIAFGPMVTPLARRRMNKLARETVALDRLSGGRLIMGVGLGFFDEKEFSAFGDEGDRRVRGRILDESLDVLAGLWSGEAFTYNGDYLQVASAPFLPTPLQRPRIPVWVAGLWPNKKPMRRAAAWDGAFPIDRRWRPDAAAEPLRYGRRHRLRGRERTTDEPLRCGPRWTQQRRSHAGCRPGRGSTPRSA